ncbi:MAG: hypothetical protein IJZ13_08020, partial [Clostridia bacterium]|nr:hypothetical protein [Clostridia bacterium]
MRITVRTIGKVSALLLAVVLLVGMLPLTALAEVAPATEPAPETAAVGLGAGMEYATYLETYGAVPMAPAAVTLTAAEAELTGGQLAEEFEGTAQVALLEEEATLTWRPSLSGTARYAVAVEYASRMEDNRRYELDVLVNGDTPYSEAAELVLHKRWYTEPAENALPDRIFKLDSYGNELTDSQTELQGWQSAALYDAEGKYNDRLLFVLGEGDELTLSFTTGYIAVASVTLMPVEELPDYATVRQCYQAAGYTAAATAPLVLQAEMPAYVSESMINATFDHLSVATQPQDAYKTLMNTLGKTYWQYTGQGVTYTFAVEQSGLYKIDLRARQNFQRGVQVGRRILLDGKVPFKELDNY